jgi:hypothetical protein
MKTLMTIALILASSIVSRADEKDAVGRYQLIYATTETSSIDSKTEEKTLWKIDTVTGRVWKFSSLSIGIKNPVLQESFVPVTTDKP